MTIDDTLFIKYLKNELTEEETRKLVAWVKESKENEEYLFGMKDAFLYLNYEHDRREADTCHEWQKFANRNGLESGTAKPTRHRHLQRVLAYAAAIAVCLLAGWQAGRLLEDSRSRTNETILLETGVGQQARTVLPDGSSVLLNACSKLTYPAGGWKDSRDVHLEGEAIFDVQHRDDAPFLVHTRHYDIRVLGTNFNVSAYQGEAEDIVTLKQGRVEIHTGESRHTAAVLKPGESFVYDNRAHTFRIEQRPLANAYAWQQRQIVFEGHTLAQKKEELFRHFGYRFTLSDGLQDMTYKATLRDESLNEFLNLLTSITPQLHYRIDPTAKTVELSLQKPARKP